MLPNRSLTPREAARYWRTQGMVKGIWIKRNEQVSYDLWLATHRWARILRRLIRFVFGEVA